MKNLRNYEDCKLSDLLQESELRVKAIKEEIKLQESFKIESDLEIVQSIIANYNMGMLTKMETMHQIKDLAGSVINQFKNLGRNEN